MLEKSSLFNKESIIEESNKNDNAKFYVYHGSSVEVKNPEVRTSRFTKDFGTGFYVTKYKHQAEKWSSRFGTGIVSVYDYSPSRNLKVLTFDSMTDAWLDFVVHCRLGGSHNYDVVEGPMSDDTIYNYVGQFIRGEFSREAFWELVKFRYPTHQIVLCTEEAISLIKFNYSYGVKM